jgi:uncharacterized PurR-regulated membrane protein YhhQ (DUF165 family)
MRTTDHRANRLFIVLAGFFLTNALIAEFVGVKIFALEDTIGSSPFHWSLFGIGGTLNFTAGVLLWPFVFIMTDVINEYFGVRGVRLISWIAVAFIAYAFLAAYLAISLAPAAFWVDVNKDLGVPDINRAYALVFGQGMWTIGGSIVAFLVGQLIDVAIFHRGSPSPLRMTAAFSSKRMYEPSARRRSLTVRTITALTTSPFLTLPPGIASLSVATMMSPMPA